jgi:hypothetical protein
MKGHDDAAADKKMFSKMLKKAMPGKKVEKHLVKDMKEEKQAYKEDKKLMGSMKKGKRGC